MPAFPLLPAYGHRTELQNSPPSGLRTSRTGGTAAFALPASASQRSLRQTAPPFSGPMKTVLPPPPPLPAGCTTAVWIDSLRALPAQSAAMRHKIAPPFSFARQHPAIRCANAAFRRRNASPISFETSKRKYAVHGGKEKMLYPNLHRCASLGNTVLNCSAQIIVFPYVARAQCIQTPNLYPVPTEYQILCCKQDTLFSSFRCRWYTFAENNFVLEPSSA